MRKCRVLVSLLTIAVFALVSSTHAQGDPEGDTLKQYMNTLKNELLSRRDATLMAIVTLDEDGHKELASLKKSYDKELLKLAGERMKLVRDFMKVHKALTADQADDLAGRYFEQEKQRQELHHRYFKMLSEKISPVVAVQFLQVQGQFETMADMERTKYVPLAE